MQGHHQWVTYSMGCREEVEKRNVWVAWLNLEAQYGDPPEEALMRLFSRAAQHCDPKAMHIALLEILEQSGRVRCLGHCRQSLS